jgi:LPXTG-motif cell wall-anchored protein
VINGCVKSVGKDGISLSTEPGFYQPHVQIIPRERLAQVLAGPERADSIWWWRLRTETGVEGWGNQDDMTPDPGPCAFGGSISAGGPTPPYPVTILPSFSFAQTPVMEQSPAQAAPPKQPAPQATPALQETLPQTGDSLEWWFLAGLLAVIMMVVGFTRRRLQAQAIATGGARRNDEKDVKN